MAMQTTQSSNQQLWESLYVKGARWSDIDDDASTDYDSGNESWSSSTASQVACEHSISRAEPVEMVSIDNAANQAVQSPPLWSVPTMIYWTPQAFWHQPAPAPAFCVPTFPTTDEKPREDVASKQKRTRPSKAKREAYRKFAAGIEAAIQADPHSVDIEKIDVPDSLAGQVDVKAMLQKKLSQRLQRMKAATLQATI